MIYKDEILTIDTDKIIGMTCVDKSIILMMNDYTQSVSYPTIEGARNAYKNIQRNFENAEKYDRVYETNYTL